MSGWLPTQHKHRSSFPTPLLSWPCQIIPPPQHRPWTAIHAWRELLLTGKNRELRVKTLTGQEQRNGKEFVLKKGKAGRSTSAYLCYLKLLWKPSHHWSPPPIQERREGTRDGGTDGCEQRTDLTDVQMGGCGVFSFFPIKGESLWTSRWPVDLVSEHPESKKQNSQMEDILQNNITSLTCQAQSHPVACWSKSSQGAVDIMWLLDVPSSDE